ncbi:hypothetical protein [Zeaxanthinibacter enoshimensis]|uniref:Lipoprotein n=1 Tax=Zeaxanthinibacter enoshimensis TaxID=392009 RepID=A0A4R6TJE5_9FLAO|nr:hypothetical protein [Zeaxanthinibacter enoshimensis]TDQ28156.1 hypothetical protein CLV82_2958 [Zeaxanthinibacter enoshimensis]
MKKTIFLVILILFSCGESIQKKSIESTDYKEHYLGFLNGKIILPKSYKKITGPELANAQVIAINRPDLEEYLTLEYERLEERGIFGNQIFVDTTNVTNYIFIRLGEYVPLDKSIANQYLGMVRSSIERGWDESGIKYKRLENKFVQTNKSDYIKIKYRMTRDGITTYQTQFLMTNNFKTFDFLVVNSENKEVENWIKRTVID